MSAIVRGAFVCASFLLAACGAARAPDPDAPRPALLERMSRAVRQQRGFSVHAIDHVERGDRAYLLYSYSDLEAFWERQRAAGRERQLRSRVAQAERRCVGRFQAQQRALRARIDELRASSDPDAQADAEELQDRLASLAEELAYAREECRPYAGVYEGDTAVSEACGIDSIAVQAFAVASDGGLLPLARVEDDTCGVPEAALELVDFDGDGRDEVIYHRVRAVYVADEEGPRRARQTGVDLQVLDSDLEEQWTWTRDFTADSRDEEDDESDGEFGLHSIRIRITSARRGAQRLVRVEELIADARCSCEVLERARLDQHGWAERSIWQFDKTFQCEPRRPRAHVETNEAESDPCREPMHQRTTFLYDGARDRWNRRE